MGYSIRRPYTISGLSHRQFYSAWLFVLDLYRLSTRGGFSMSLSPEELRVQEERFIEEVLNNRNLSLMEEFVAPEYILQGSQPPIQGPDGYRQFIESILVIY